MTITPKRRTIMEFQTWDSHANAIYSLSKTYALEGEPLEVSALRTRFAQIVESYNSNLETTKGLFSEFNNQIRDKRLKETYTANRQKLYTELTAIDNDVKALLVTQQAKLKDTLFPLSKDKVVGQLVLSSAANVFDQISDSSLGRKKFIYTPETLISQGQIDVLNYLIMFEETREGRTPDDIKNLADSKKFIADYFNTSILNTNIVYLERLHSEIGFVAWQFQDSGASKIEIGFAERLMNEEFNIALKSAKGLA